MADATNSSTAARARQGLENSAAVGEFRFKPSEAGRSACTPPSNGRTVRTPHPDQHLGVAVERPPDQRSVLLRHGASVGRALVRRFNLLVDYFIPSAHKRRKLSEAEMAHYREAMPTPERRHACAALPGEIIGARQFFTDLADQLSALEKLPTLIVWADADPIFNDKYRERWEATFPNHTTTVLHGVGHFLQSDAPAEFSEAIDTWWAELAGDGGTAS
jgi:pimeloyl-ACP methyl ester carboxylesterase